MGESRKAFEADADVRTRTHIGGQALIEGIMMRGRYNWAVAVRTPDGDIYTEEHDLASGRKKNAWMYWPVIRGCTAFVESLALGYKALGISSEHAYDWNEEEDGEAEDGKKSGGMGGLMTISMIVGIILGIAIFVVLPAALSNLVLGEASMNSVAWNIFDGIVRVAIFILYIWLISLMKDIRRMFSYHGAEHKIIHCYEHGEQLEPGVAMHFPRLHVRCGTAFIIMVMLIAIFVYTVLGQPINALVDLTGVTEGPLRFVLIMITRIILLPIIAGVSYEVTVKWAGSHPDSKLVRIILWPGMQMQRLTTNPPDEGMIECAIAAMNIVLAREELEARKAARGEQGA
ncbi:MAG: DUF1385 domain-containing protein [Coriobacteriales bacterium]